MVDILRERQLSVDAFAEQMCWSIAYTEGLIGGTAPLTEEVARRLAKHLGASTDFWIRREGQYQDAQQRLSRQELQSWVKSLPTKDMVRAGWISNATDLIEECLRYFNVANLAAWQRRYATPLTAAAFHTSTTFALQPGPVAAWLRYGEIEAERRDCQPWNPTLLNSQLPAIKRLTKQKDPAIFLPQLIALCADCGVAVVVARAPAGCVASGATKFVSPDRALLMLSFRHLTDDHFWFTFFHEVGHLLLHGPNELFLEGAGKDVWDERKEEEANSFSADLLIPPSLRPRLPRLPLTRRGIVTFAIEAGTSPGIVIGQLQHLGRVPHQKLNTYKRRYEWPE
ncbi:ImmA/IrrE family metallo-endopeptidase [Hymenobacter terrigena]